MRVVVIGAGEVGINIARKLSQEKADVVIIDQDGQRLGQMADMLDVQAVEGSGANPAVLEAAGVRTADLIIAATDSDEANILTCRMAQLLAPASKRIARIREAQYYDSLDIGLLKEAMGISVIINPVEETVESILDFISIPGASDVITVAKGRLHLVGIRLHGHNSLVGEKLADSLSRDKDHQILVSAIYRNNELLIPRGDTVLKTGDLVYVSVADKHLDQVCGFFGLKNEPAKNVVIMGGGELGFRLAQTMEERHFSNVKLLELDAKRCEFLSEALTKTMVLKGDGTDQDLLQEENIGECDVFIALSTDDEKNIISSLLARRLGAQQTITRVNRFSYVPLVSAVGLDSLVSLRLSAVSAILKHVRRGRVLSVTTIQNESAEIIEFGIKADSPVAGKTLKEAGFPRGAIIAALTRGDEIIIPRGDAVIEAGDTLVAVANTEAVKKLEDLVARED